MLMELQIWPQVSPLSTVLHAALIYLFLFIAFRLMGRHEFGEFTTFDLVLLLIVSESVSNALSQGDNSLATAFISAGTLLALTMLMSIAKYKSKRFNRIVGGTSRRLVRDGQVDRNVMRREMMRMEDVMTGLREKGVDDISKVKEAYVEEDGTISVITREPDNG